MGTYLIPDARSVSEAAAHLGTDPPAFSSWALTPAGILYTAEFVDDAEAAALYAGFVPGATNPGDWPRLPEELRAHAIHLRDFGRLDAGGLAARTDAEVRHVLRDVCRALALLVDRRLD